MQARKQVIHPLDAFLKLVFLGKETAHRQVLFHRHTGKHATPFRHNRYRFAHDFRRLPVGNVFTIKDDSPAGRSRVATQCAEQRGFSRAVGTNQSNDFTLVDIQADVMQRLYLAVVGVDFVER